MSRYLTWDKNNYASNLFNLLEGHHYAIPKPKFLFYVEFNVNPFAKRLLNQDGVQRRLSFMVKSLDRPNISYNQVELNQYNKKRLVTTGVQYGTMSITLHDTVDEIALKMIKDYNDHYYKDFRNDLRLWRYDQTHNKNNTNVFGYNLRGSGTDIYFFDSIDVYEFYNGYYTQYSLVHPKIETASFGNNDMQSSEGSEVTLAFRMEGLIHKEIAAPMNASVSRKVGLPFQRGTTGNFPLIAPKTVGTGLPISRSTTLYSLSDLGGSIRGTLGSIAMGIIGNVLAPAVIGVLGNALNNAGLGILTPLATGAVLSGARSVQNSVGRLF